MRKPPRSSDLTRRTFIATTGAGAAGAVLTGSSGCSDDGAGGKLPRERDTRVVRAAIHPGIGVARIGNSRSGFFIGPETIEPSPTRAADMRDAAGAIKRQAARFRVYGYNAAGELVGELNASTGATVEWQVHLANKKSQWYRFLAALDIPDAVGMSCPRRNVEVRGEARRALAIDPGPRTIAGQERSGAEFQFDTGTFKGIPVPLGELRTDAEGRLLVLSGPGKSASPSSAPVFVREDPDTFNNADDWFDDIADGPVSARVTINGETVPVVESSWVVVAPPNYAPDIIGWRTLYDLLVDVYVDAGWLTEGSTPSFTRDVLPTLRRLSGLQWVNQGFARAFGRGGRFDFDDPNLIARLSHQPIAPGEPDLHAELRREILQLFRPPETGDPDRQKWPWIYGDAFGSFAPDSPRNNLALSRRRASHLSRWAEGNFVADWNPRARPLHSIDDVDLADQPDMLDQAALHFCLADAFHPGCEVTWPMRHITLYRAPFRILEKPGGEMELPGPEQLTARNVGLPGGPLSAQSPGDLTRWMAVPWQGDTIFCRSGYEPEFDPFIPTFWPARVPNHVLSEEDYAIAVDPGKPREQRLAAFTRRQHWVRTVGAGPAPVQILQMVERFAAMGIIEERRGVEGDPVLPARMWVESLPPQLRRAMPPAMAAAVPEAARAPGEAPDPIREAGWEDADQLAEFRAMRIRRPR